MTNKKNGTLYIGVTNDISRRGWEHREGQQRSFTQKYGLKMLVYYEAYPRIIDAINREKAMKFWKRAWKIEAIEKMNPDWRDLYLELNGVVMDAGFRQHDGVGAM